MGANLYGAAIDYVIHDVIFTQKLLQQFPNANVVGDEINLNTSMYPQTHKIQQVKPGDKQNG